MKRFVFVAGLLYLGLAHAEMNYFTEYELSNCHVYQIHKESRELCTLSEPDGEKKRKFSMTVRDPSQLDTKSKSPGALQAAKHKLVAEQHIQVGADEYVQYERVLPFNLNDDLWLILVPIVKGTPDDYDVARSELYFFNGKKFTLEAQMPNCEPNCRDQTIQIRSAANSPNKTIMVIQRTKDGSKSVDLKWDGKKLSR